MAARVIAVLFLVAAAGAAACTSATMNMLPRGRAFAPNVTLVVGLPLQLEFATTGFEGGIGRRFGDSLLAATGGRAVVPEELTGSTAAQVTQTVRALGGDPEHAVTFAVRARRSARAESAPSPLRGVRSSAFVVVDYVVRLEVRRVGLDEVLGSIDTVASAAPEDPKAWLAGPARALQAAINDAVSEAVRKFATSLWTTTPPLRLIEAPPGPEATLPAADRQMWLELLYPEHPPELLRPLAASQARYLVLAPGPLSKIGVAPGDLLTGLRARPMDGRAALARKLATGRVPAMAVERGGQRFLINEKQLPVP